MAVKASIEKKAGWDDTKKVLDEGLAATKREVDESLKAFNQERDFYAAAVGIPGLRTAQYVLDHMMPGLFAQKLEASLANSIGNMKHKNMKRMILKRVNAGKSAPLLTGARFYDVGEETMAFDLDMKWSSDVTRGHGGRARDGPPPGTLAKVPVQMHNVGFDGTVRVMLAKLQRNGAGVRRHRGVVPGPAVDLVGHQARGRVGGEPRAVAEERRQRRDEDVDQRGDRCGRSG